MRVAADADVDVLALIGASYIVFGGYESAASPAETIEKVVTATVADVVQRRLL